MTNKEWLNRGWMLLGEIESLEMAREKAVAVRGKEKAAEYTKKTDRLERELVKVYLQILKAILKTLNQLIEKTY